MSNGMSDAPHADARDAAALLDGAAFDNYDDDDYGAGGAAGDDTHHDAHDGRR
jgi:hypothetical protein